MRGRIGLTGRGKSRVHDDDGAGFRGGAGRGNSANYTAVVKYSGCMQTHGVPNFSDPAGSGVFLSRQRNVVDRNSSQFASANTACLHLLPSGGKPTAAQTQQGLAQELKFVQCMRSHGVTKVPRPAAAVEQQDQPPDWRTRLRSQLAAVPGSQLGLQAPHAGRYRVALAGTTRLEFSGSEVGHPLPAVPNRYRSVVSQQHN
jgi:hypothetical protein